MFLRDDRSGVSQVMKREKGGGDLDDNSVITRMRQDEHQIQNHSKLDRNTRTNSATRGPRDRVWRLVLSCRVDFELETAILLQNQTHFEIKCMSPSNKLFF